MVVVFFSTHTKKKQKVVQKIAIHIATGAGNHRLKDKQTVYSKSTCIKADNFIEAGHVSAR